MGARLDRLLNIDRTDTRHESMVYTPELLQAMVYGPDYYLALIPALVRARAMTIDTVSQLPPAAWRGVAQVEPNPPYVELPNTDQTRNAFKADTMAALIDHGNAYWIVNVIKDNDLRVAHPADVKVRWNSDRTRRLYTWRDSQLRHRRKSEAADLPRIIHLALDMGVDQTVGRSPITQTRLAGIAAHLAYSADYFTNAAIPSAVIEHPAVLSSDDAARLREQWDAAHKGERFTAVLSSGMTFKPLPLTPQSSEWDAVYQSGLLDVANMLGVPPYFLGYSGSAGPNTTYANIGDLMAGWMRQALQPTFMHRIERAWSLLTPHGTRVQLNPDEITRGNRAARYASHQVGLDAGFLTIDEVRRIEGLPPITGQTDPNPPTPEAAV